MVAVIGRVWFTFMCFMILRLLTDLNSQKVQARLLSGLEVGLYFMFLFFTELVSLFLLECRMGVR